MKKASESNLTEVLAQYPVGPAKVTVNQQGQIDGEGLETMSWAEYSRVLGEAVLAKDVDITQAEIYPRTWYCPVKVVLHSLELAPVVRVVGRLLERGFGVSKVSRAFDVLDKVLTASTTWELLISTPYRQHNDGFGKNDKPVTVSKP